MDRFAAMLILLVFMVVTMLLVVKLFTIAPILCSCLVSLLYSLYLFMAYEESGGQTHGQEFENRFWTIFAILLSTALLFAKDSPMAFGLWYSPSGGFICVFLSGYAMHIWDRHQHRIAISKQTALRLRRSSHNSSMNTLGNSLPSNNNGTSAISSNSNSNNQGNCLSPHNHSSLLQLQNLGIPVSAQLDKINSCLMEIDQLLIPSTINNFINNRFVLSKEREIIRVFEECDARALNYLISHVKLGLLFYKIKDHNYFNGKNRTELINLLAIERLPILTVISRVILLHSIQLLQIRANPRAEDWVRNILLTTHQDELSELKTLTDAKGDYFCMNQLIYNDIRSISVRQDILNHIRREAAIQQTHMQMGTRTRFNSYHHNKYFSVPSSRFAVFHQHGSSHYQPQQLAWRKILSDVDDTLCCSGGMYPAGIDKRYPKKTVYPGVLAFYRELDLGPNDLEEWPEGRIGNLVFLSARPHVYKDMSEKRNFAKFELLRANSSDGRKGMHTMPSLLPGDLSSGGQYLFTDDFEPLAQKKFENFRQYVSIYPEYQHIFVCDNGQGDVRAGELMFDNFPYEFNATIYVHIVQDIDQTYGYNPTRWHQKEFKPCFFRTYPEAALHAACKQKPPLISVRGVKRICQDAIRDFMHIKNWTNDITKSLRRQELNQGIWLCNDFLIWNLEEPLKLIKADQRYDIGQKVRTPYGIGIILGFEPYFDLYDVELDWRPLDIQLKDHLKEVQKASIKPRMKSSSSSTNISSHANATVPSGASNSNKKPLATVVETTEDEDNIPTTRSLATSINTDDATINTLDNDSVIHPYEQLDEQQHVPRNNNMNIFKGSSSNKTQEIGEPSSERSERGIDSYGPVNLSSTSNPTSTPGLHASDFVVTPHQLTSRDISNRNAVRAKIAGRCISKYSPPVLPKFDSKSHRGSLFPFLTKMSDGGKKSTFKAGDKWNTPYGPAKIIEYREKNGIVVVEMIGWKAKGYMKQDTLKRIPSSHHSLFGNLLRQLSSGMDVEKKTPTFDYPYGEGTSIQTPFGKGTIIRALPSPALKNPTTVTRHGTVAISLQSWTLANGKHPILYSTAETTKLWKESKATDLKSILSTIGTTLVTTSRSLLLEPFLIPKYPPTEVIPKILFKQYYKDAAAVMTPYGEGRVIRFRESDGYYEISLTRWKLNKGSNAKVYLREDDISHHIAKGCLEGYPVLTSLGLTGRLASVDPKTGVHLVTIPSIGIVCYLQPSAVIRPLKAAVNEDILSPYGNGKVIRYNPSQDVYTIQLSWASTLHAKGDTFDRVIDYDIPDEEARFGVNWLLSFFFRSSDSSTLTRSRSNSIVSASHSHSNRSGA